jgi:hypothetical protein
MPALNKREWRKLRALGNVAGDFDKMLKAFRALDRTVVEISMRAYNLPRRDRAAMRRQHRRLHETIRAGLSGLLVTAVAPQGSCAASE